MESIETFDSPLPVTASAEAPCCGMQAVYGSLFAPLATYRTIAAFEPPSGRLLGVAAASVLYISVLAPVLQAIVLGTGLGELGLSIPLAAVSGLMTWALCAVVFGLLAYAFTGTMRLRLFLVLSGLATLPWLFMAPLALVRSSIGGPFAFVLLMVGLVIWAWSAGLFMLALATTYRLTIERTLAVLVMPLLMMGVFIAWTSGFLVNIIRLMPR